MGGGHRLKDYRDEKGNSKHISQFDSMSLRQSKRRGTIEPPRDILRTVKQKVTVDNKTMVITEYHTKRIITIYIGSAKIYCVDITLYKDDNDICRPRGDLNNIRWDGECFLYHPFEQGTDTIMIFKLAMTYIHRTYPTVTEVTFTDMSTRQCDNGASVSLSSMKLFTEGKTWYESHLHAHMDPGSEVKYKAMMAYTIEQKKAISWNEFVDYTSNNSTILHINRIKEIYQSSKTWQEFFLYVRSQLGMSAFCICLSEDGWFDTFIQKRLDFNLMSIRYMIHPSSYDMKYILEPAKGGNAQRLSKGIQRSRHTLRKQKE
jgi:hypothetical protein